MTSSEYAYEITKVPGLIDVIFKEFLPVDLTSAASTLRLPLSTVKVENLALKNI